MEIFILHEDSKLCAEYHENDHLDEIIYEVCKVFSALFKKKGWQKEFLLKPSQEEENDAWTNWAEESFYNFIWLLDFGNHCLNECEIRFPEHFEQYNRECGKILLFALKNSKSLHLKKIRKDKDVTFGTSFPLTLENKFKIKSDSPEKGFYDIVSSYRKYYCEEMPHSIWKRSVPSWFVDNVDRKAIVEKAFFPDYPIKDQQIEEYALGHWRIKPKEINLGIKKGDTVELADGFIGEIKYYYSNQNILLRGNEEERTVSKEEIVEVLEL